MNFTARLLYRAKAKKDGSWMFGAPHRANNKWYIRNGKTITEVDPLTMSQSTGKIVKGNKMVFEGDILFVAKNEKVTVVWNEELAGFNTDPVIKYAAWGWHEATVDHSGRLEIIGNKWDGETTTTKRKVAGANETTPQYPIVNQDRKYHILHPVMLKNGKWAGAEVLLGSRGGYTDPNKNPGKHQFNTENECQRACNIHNDFHFGIKTQAGKNYVNDIISKSMSLSRKAQEVRKKAGTPKKVTKPRK